METKHLSSAKDDVHAIINYVGSSTNQELQACYEHSVREIPTKEQKQMSVQTKVSANPNYYVPKQVQLLSLYQLKMLCNVHFLYFLNKGSTLKLFTILTFCKFMHTFLMSV